MQLIFIFRSKTRSLSLGPVQMVGGFLLFLSVVFLAGAFLYYATLSAGLLDSVPFLKDMVISQYLASSEKEEQIRRQNIDTMASRIGGLQAKLLELDATGKRLGEIVGLKYDAEMVSEKSLSQKPSGGPLIFAESRVNEQDLTLMIDDLLHQIDRRSDYLIRLENQLTSESVRLQLFPGQLPVEELYMTSGYGGRRDPFTGRSAVHEGVDFAAPVGTPILAAASGVVRYAEYHPQYGYMVDVDHGNGLLTRYAHCSALYVRAGAFIKRGDHIASVGNTGRSTGPHLHFEVRENGASVNPLAFLRRQG